MDLAKNILGEGAALAHVPIYYGHKKDKRMDYREIEYKEYGSDFGAYLHSSFLSDEQLLEVQRIMETNDVTEACYLSMSQLREKYPLKGQPCVSVALVVQGSRAYVVVCKAGVTTKSIECAIQERGDNDFSISGLMALQHLALNTIYLQDLLAKGESMPKDQMYVNFIKYVHSLPVVSNVTTSEDY